LQWVRKIIDALFIPLEDELKGNRVLMVSGSDAHGTPTSLEAARYLTARTL
jgi:hypothetical protein